MYFAELCSLVLVLCWVRSRFISAMPRKSTWSRRISSRYSLKSPPEVPKLRPQGFPKYTRKTWSGLLSGGDGPIKLFSLRCGRVDVSVPLMIWSRRESLAGLFEFIGHRGEGGIQAHIGRSMGGFSWL